MTFSNYLPRMRCPISFIYLASAPHTIICWFNTRDDEIELDLLLQITLAFSHYLPNVLFLISHFISLSPSITLFWLKTPTLCFFIGFFFIYLRLSFFLNKSHPLDFFRFHSDFVFPATSSFHLYIITL